MAPESDVPRRPSWPRRFAAGAWHAPAAAIFLLRHPRLWGLALLPAVLGAAGLGAGLLLGVYGVQAVERFVAGHRLGVPDLMDLVVVIGLWGGTLSSGVLAALALAFLLCAPLLERLGWRVEALGAGQPAPPWPSAREIPSAFGRASLLLLAVPIGFGTSLLPVVGPFLATFGLAQALAIQQAAPPLSRRGRGFAARRAWHHQWRAESLGFGVSGLLLLPLAPLLVPALSIGAARLVQEIEGDAEAPPSS
jgi:uncharacterized protein involved in cysteine biosynthesis